MCLTTKQEKPLVAKRRIKVYKMCIRNEENMILMTPYMHREIPTVPYILKADGKPSIEKNKYSTRGKPVKYDIGAGFIHAYTLKEYAFVHQRKYMNLYFGDVVLIEGFVPKGAVYYEGEDGDICASSMVLRKIYSVKSIKGVSQ